MSVPPFRIIAQIIRSITSYSAVFTETVIAVITDNYVIDQRYVHYFPCFLQLAGYLNVSTGRITHLAGMVMGYNQPAGLRAHCLTEQFPDINVHGITRTDEDVPVASNPCPVVQKDCHKVFLAAVSVCLLQPFYKHLRIIQNIVVKNVKVIHPSHQFKRGQ